MSNNPAYIVSSISLNEFENHNELFISDEYISRVNKIKGIKSPRLVRENRKDFEKDVELLNGKYNKYLKQLGEILNKENCTNFSDDFWKKSLGLGFRRFVHISYDAFILHSKNFDPLEFDFGVLKIEEFIFSKNFEDFVSNFSHNEKGFEQFFSIFVNTFYDVNAKNCRKISSVNNDRQTPSKKNNNNIVKKIKSITRYKVFRIFLSFIIFRRPRIGVFHSYFSQKNKVKMILKSLGLVKDIDFIYNKDNCTVSIDNRKNMFKNFKENDQFDIFFRNLLVYNFPTFFIEGFQSNYIFYLSQAHSNRSLRFAVSEGWLSDTDLSFYLAILKEKYSVRHIYNEHNYFEHPYLGHRNNLICSMVDVFLTIGWASKNKCYTSSASLFEFRIDKYIFNNKNQITYISAASFVKNIEINCAYGENGENSAKYLKFISLFFNNISNDVYEKINYRGYPDKGWIVNPKDDCIDFSKLKCIDNYQCTSKEQMLRSSLVVIDYLATSFLESLLMNVPTIILFNQDTYFLEDENKHFYDELIKANIFQSSPENAAYFINAIHEDIGAWWYSRETQVLRRSFLQKNIGRPDDVISTYLSFL